MTFPLRGSGLWGCAILIVGLMNMVLRAAEPPVISTPPEVKAAVANLGSSEFTKRQAAEKQLVAMGAPAFAPLIANLNKVSLESGQHILVILEQIWLQAALPEADDLERQLDAMRLTWGPYQPDAERLLSAHHRLREERAAKALRRLNAIIESDDDTNEMELQILMGQPPVAETPKRIVQIILPRSWKGKDADLWHIQRLSHLKFLNVFVVKGNGISEEAKLQMQVGFPDIKVSERAEVFIGIESSPYDSHDGCHVVRAQPGSPAEYAGLEPGDLIVSVDGVEITNFMGLVDSLKSKRAYEPIELEVQRGYFYELPTEDGKKRKPLQITVIGVPWEVRQFPTPPPPPESETLIHDAPFPEIPPLPGLHAR